MVAVDGAQAYLTLRDIPAGDLIDGTIQLRVQAPLASIDWNGRISTDTIGILQVDPW